MVVQPPKTSALDGLTPAVVIAATLDTKHREVALMVEALRAKGLDAILIDCGVLGEPGLKPQVTAREVAAFGGAELDELKARRDRPAALQAMRTGLANCLEALLARKLVLGFLGLGGGTNAALAGAAFEQLPYDLPNLLVATTVSGDMTRVVGAKDVTLIHSVVDVLGTSAYLRDLFARTAAVMRALVETARAARPASTGPCVGLTAFGSTTAAADAAFGHLVAAGYEVFTFHARGSGGRAAEAFMRDGKIQAMLDLTTTEIADEVVGGTMSAGPTRLDAAVAMALPQVLLPGAIDMVNFGGREAIPARFSGRTFLQHTPTATLMRTTAAENAEIARFIARKLESAEAPTAIIVPLRGFSAYDAPGAPFFDPEADKAFLDTLQASLRPDIPVLTIDAHINDPAVAEIAVQTLLQFRSGII